MKDVYEFQFFAAEQLRKRDNPSTPIMSSMEKALWNATQACLQAELAGIIRGLKVAEDLLPFTDRKGVAIYRLALKDLIEGKR